MTPQKTPEQKTAMESKPTELTDFPIDLIIDKMRDDYEGRHWGDEDEDEDE